MKTKLTSDQNKKLVVSGALALIILGSLCWPLRRHSPKAGKSPAPAHAQALAPSTTATVVMDSDLRQVSFIPGGPVSGAADATEIAVLAANGVAHRDYGIEPFKDLRSTARFDGSVWLWRKRVGCGTGDLEAEVRIKPDGTVKSITVQCLTQQIEAKSVGSER